MPVYNAERYLAEAIESVLSQSFGDFEFLILDDGSSDQSLSVIEKHAARDPRIRVVARENRGLTETLNELAGMARGRYLARFDSDDICLPGRFERQVAYLDAHPDCVVVGGWAIMIDEAGRPIVPLMPPMEHEEIDAGNLNGNVSLIHPAVMIRSAALSRAGLYDTGYPHAQDNELWLRMAEIGHLANLPQVLLQYRMHGQSVSTRYHGAQQESSQRASAAAAARRGVSNPVRLKPFRSDGSRENERDFSIRYGWQAWTWGFRATWWHYAMRAIRLAPLSPAAWKLVVFGAIRPSPKKAVLKRLAGS